MGVPNPSELLAAIEHLGWDVTSTRNCLPSSQIPREQLAGTLSAVVDRIAFDIGDSMTNSAMFDSWVLGYVAACNYNDGRPEPEGSNADLEYFRNGIGYLALRSNITARAIYDGALTAVDSSAGEHAAEILAAGAHATAAGAAIVHHAVCPEETCTSGVPVLSELATRLRVIADMLDTLDKPE